MKRAVTSGKRLNHEPPAVTAKLGWRYHHIGIPHAQPRAQEHHVAHLGVHISGFETSPFGIEWIRFEPHCRVPEIVRTVPHVAFAVDDLNEALKGREILIAPTEPSVGVRVAFILDDGAPVELVEFYTAKAVPPKDKARCRNDLRRLVPRRGRNSSQQDRRHPTKRTKHVYAAEVRQ
jgi:hypothetical protein